jgi:hypothetical protein
MRLPILVATILVGAMAVSAIAAEPKDPSGASTFLKVLDSGSESEKAVTRIVLQSYSQGYGWANAHLNQRKQALLYCQPPALVITGGMTADILARYLALKPQHADLPIGYAVLVALQHTFPCS